MSVAKVDHRGEKVVAIWRAGREVEEWGASWTRRWSVLVEIARRATGQRVSGGGGDGAEEGKEEEGGAEGLEGEDEEEARLLC